MRNKNQNSLVNSIMSKTNKIHAYLKCFNRLNFLVDIIKTQSKYKVLKKS
jgi:hypothetical protein